MRPHALFEPRLIKDDLLVGEYEIPFGDQDDRVLICFPGGKRSSIKELIAFNTPRPMSYVWVRRQHRPGAVRPVEIVVPRRFPFADEKFRERLTVGFTRRGMLFDLGVDSLPCVSFSAGSLFAQSNKARDV